MIDTAFVIQRQIDKAFLKLNLDTFVIEDFSHWSFSLFDASLFGCLKEATRVSTLRDLDEPSYKILEVELKIND